MFRDYFLILLFAHILASFYMVPENFMARKEKTFGWLMLHGLIYWVCIMLLSLPMISQQLVLYGSLFALTHTIFDSWQFFQAKVNNKTAFWSSGKSFFLDQILHLISMAILAYVFILRKNILVLQPFFSQVLSLDGNFFRSLLIWANALLLIHRPANLAISKLLLPYKPADKSEGKNAGRLIGSLERIIILLLIFLKQ